MGFSSHSPPPAPVFALGLSASTTRWKAYWVRDCISLILRSRAQYPPSTETSYYPRRRNEAHSVAPRHERRNRNTMSEHDYAGFAALLQASAEAGCVIRINISDPDGRIADLDIENDGDGWVFSQEVRYQALEPSGALAGLTLTNVALLEGGVEW